MARIDCAVGIRLHAAFALCESKSIQAGLLPALLWDRRFNVRSLCGLRVAIEQNGSLHDLSLSGVLFGDEDDIMGLRLLTAGKLPLRDGSYNAPCKSFVNSLLGLDNLEIR